MDKPTSAPNPIRNSYWVVPGRVLAGEHPSATTPEATRERLQRLMDAGVECFIDLTEPGEVKPYDPELPLSVEYLRKPIRDHGIPAQRAHMAEILDCIHDALQSGRCVYVHCRAGIGRTGTVVGCLLVERGLEGEAALDELNRLWQHCDRAQSWASVPETDDQVTYVRKWKARAVFAEELALASAAAREALVGKGGRGAKAARELNTARDANAGRDVNAGGDATAGREASGGGAAAKGTDQPGLLGLGLPLLDEEDDDDLPIFPGVNKPQPRKVGQPSGAVRPTAPAQPTDWPSFGKATPAGQPPASGANTGPARSAAALAPGTNTGAARSAPGANVRTGSSAPAPASDTTGTWRSAAALGANTGAGPSATPLATGTNTGAARSGAASGANAATGPSATAPASDTTGTWRSAAASGANTGVGPPSATAPPYYISDTSQLATAFDAASAAARPATGSAAISGSARGASDSVAARPTTGSGAASGSTRSATALDVTSATDTNTNTATPGGRATARPESTSTPNIVLADDPFSDPETLSAVRSLRDRFLGALLGLAVGDAVAAATQFRKPGTFTAVGDMIGGGPFDLPRGAWTDDTAMALCLADSLLERNGFDARDQMERYRRWQQEGYLTSTGQCVGITASTARAIAMSAWRRGALFGSHDPAQLDPEPLSRVAPAVMFFFAASGQAVDQATEAARTTCQAPAVLEACRSLARAVHAALAGQPKSAVLEKAVQAIGNAPGRTATGISASAALTAAVAAFGATANFRDAVLYAANLGGDSDVIAAVCGQLAGAFYSVKAIPTSWHNGLMQKELVISYADRLLAHAMLGLSG